MNRKIRTGLASLTVGCMVLGLGSLTVGAASAATPAAVPAVAAVDGCYGVTVTLAQTAPGVIAGTMKVAVTGAAIVTPMLVNQTTGVTIIATGFKGPDVQTFNWDNTSVKAKDVLQGFLGPNNPCGDPLKVEGPVVPTNNPPVITPAGPPTCAQPGGQGVASFDVMNPNNIGISYQILAGQGIVRTVEVGAGQTARIDISRPPGTYSFALRAAGSVTNPVPFTIVSCDVTPPAPVAAQPTLALKDQPVCVKEGESTSVDLLITNTADDTHQGVVYSLGGQTVTLADGASGVLSVSLPSGTHQVSVTGDDGTSVALSVTVTVCESSTPTPTPTQTASPTTTPTSTPTSSTPPVTQPASSAPAVTTSQTAVVETSTQAVALPANNNTGNRGGNFHTAAQSQAGPSPWTIAGALLLMVAGIAFAIRSRLGYDPTHA